MAPSSPRCRAARTTLAAFPPATTDRMTGRWMAPATRRSTETVLSTAALRATPTTRRIGAPDAVEAVTQGRQPAPPPRPPRGSAGRPSHRQSRVDSDPQATARRSAASSGRPSSQAARNPASNESPAPVVSTASTAIAAARGERAIRSRRRARRPRRASRRRSRRGARRSEPSDRAAASTSSMPASARHSAAFGSRTSASAAAARKPAVPGARGVPVRDRGSSSRRPRGPPGTAVGTSAASPGWRK